MPVKKKKKNCSRALSSWEEYILTLVRTRKGFDVRFLADTFGISYGQVSRIYNTWATFLFLELSFLIPWPTQAQISAKLPKRFAKFSNVRVIVDCMELYIQKPHLPSSQKAGVATSIQIQPRFLLVLLHVISFVYFMVWNYF